jgi:hypothetical protein
MKRGIALVKSGGTHGALDDLSSTGVLLSSFAPTKDTSTSRVAALFDGFKGRRDSRSEASGAEWLSRKVGDLRTADAREPQDLSGLSMDELFLRIWAPALARLDPQAPINMTVKMAGIGLPARFYQPPKEQSLELYRAASFPAGLSGERTYAIPTSLTLQPQTLYRISIWIQDGNQRKQVFKFTSRTDSRGMPITPAVEIGNPGPSKMTAKS